MNESSTLLFTPSAVVDLLLQITELKGKSISIAGNSNSIDLMIGNVAYSIQPEYSTSVDLEVTQSDIEEINNAESTNYETLGYEPVDSINSGIVKQFLKTLLIGGFVRLTTKLLK